MKTNKIRNFSRQTIAVNLSTRKFPFSRSPFLPFLLLCLLTVSAQARRTDIAGAARLGRRR